MDMTSFDRIQALRHEAINDRLRLVLERDQVRYDDLDDLRIAMERVWGINRIVLHLLIGRVAESFWQLPDSWTMPTIAEAQSIRAAIDAQEAT